jgi:low affinity Fe/Cu permease
MITMQRARLGNYLLLLGALGVVIALVGWAIGGPLHAYALASNLALAVAFLSLIGYVLLQPKVRCCCSWCYWSWSTCW